MEALRLTPMFNVFTFVVPIAFGKNCVARYLVRTGYASICKYTI